MSEPNTIEANFAERFAAWGIRLPSGATRSGRPGALRQAGWLILYGFQQSARGEFLEYYATHRMTNDRRERIFASGETEDLETIWGFGMCSWNPEIPGDRERATKEYDEHNRNLAKELHSLGLYPTGDINAFLHTHAE